MSVRSSRASSPDLQTSRSSGRRSSGVSSVSAQSGDPEDDDILDLELVEGWVSPEILVHLGNPTDLAREGLHQNWMTRLRSGGHVDDAQPDFWDYTRMVEFDQQSACMGTPTVAPSETSP